MHCQAFEDLSVYADGELDPEEELSVRRHLDTCTACQQAVQMLAALKDAVARTAAVYPLPHTLRATFHARPQPSRWRLFSWRPLFKAGFVAVLMS